LVSSPANVRGSPANVRDSLGNVRDSLGNVRGSLANVRGSPANVRDSLGNLRDSLGNLHDSAANVAVFLAGMLFSVTARHDFWTGGPLYWKTCHRSVVAWSFCWIAWSGPQSV